MITVYILEGDDIIKEDDWVRPLKLEYEGQSDYLHTSSTYSGGRVNRLGWIRVKEYMPFWAGKTLNQFYNRKWHYPPTQLEIVRGDVPYHHQEDGVTYWHVSKFDKPTKVTYASKGGSDD